MKAAVVPRRCLGRTHGTPPLGRRTGQRRRTERENRVEGSVETDEEGESRLVLSCIQPWHVIMPALCRLCAPLVFCVSPPSRSLCPLHPRFDRFYNWLQWNFEYFSWRRIFFFFLFIIRDLRILEKYSWKCVLVFFENLKFLEIFIDRYFENFLKPGNFVILKNISKVYLFSIILEILKLCDFANSRNFVALKNILGI